MFANQLELSQVELASAVPHTLNIKEYATYVLLITVQFVAPQMFATLVCQVLFLLKVVLVDVLPLTLLTQPITVAFAPPNTLSIRILATIATFKIASYAKPTEYARLV